MTSQAKRDCVKNMSMTTFWKKEILFEEGDVGNYFFFILSGSVVIRKRHGSTSTSLCILGPGDSFGELALSRQSTDGTRTATVVSREVSEFLVLHKVHYLENLSKYQESDGNNDPKSVKFPRKRQRNLPVSHSLSSHGMRKSGRRSNNYISISPPSYALLQCNPFH